MQTLKRAFLCLCMHYDLPSCVLVLAHSAGVSLLRSDAVQGVVSVGGDPGDHLERRRDTLVWVLLDSSSQQVIQDILGLLLTVRVIVKLSSLSLLTSSSAGQ